MLNPHVVAETLFQFKMFFLENSIKTYTLPSIFIEPDQNIFRMTGKDTISFLNRISTNKIVISDDINSSKTILTNNKGSIVEVVKYKILDSENLIFTFNSNNSETINYLNNYIILEDVKITLENKVSKVSFFSKKENFPSELLNYSYITNLDKYEDLFRYELFVEKKNLTKILNLQSLNILSKLEKNFLEISMKLFDYESNLSKINPLETGFENFISFDKGCYVGQEVIARLHNYKKVSREIIYFKSEEMFKINDYFKNRKGISGKILSIEKINNYYLGLCLIKKKYITLLNENYIFI